MDVQNQFGDEVTFIGVPGLADTSSMSEFVAEQGVTGFPHIPDDTGEIWSRFGVTEQRTYVLIDNDGTWRRTGYGTLREDVEALIAG